MLESLDSLGRGHVAAAHDGGVWWWLVDGRTAPVLKVTSGRVAGLALCNAVGLIVFSARTPHILMRHIARQTSQVL